MPFKVLLHFLLSSARYSHMTFTSIDRFSATHHRLKLRPLERSLTILPVIISFLKPPELFRGLWAQCFVVNTFFLQYKVSGRIMMRLVARGTLAHNYCGTPTFTSEERKIWRALTANHDETFTHLLTSLYSNMYSNSFVMLYLRIRYKLWKR